ncbi:MAG: type II secretion system GspH family protein [Lentisphaeraceae bacterium]|nr:type II secretion system GspH family protein [Lentisphaeraceae bacterium]
MGRFTLIELLVVIAIIGVLCSMLLPSLRQARGTAKSAVCASNIKQLGVGFEMYQLGSDGYTPPAITILANGSFLGWHSFINEHFNATNDSLSKMAPFNCPMNEFQTQWSGMGLGRSDISYGGNGWTGIRLNQDPPATTPVRALGINIATVKSPSELYLLADTVYYRIENNNGGIHARCGANDCDNSYADHGGMLKYEHLSKLNMLYTDKHVKKLKRVTVKTNTSLNWFADP